MRRFILIVAAVIVLALIAIPVVIALSGPRPNVAAAQSTGGGFGPGSRSSSLQKATVDKGDIELTVSATGSIVAKRQSNLSFTTPGRVTQIMVTEGQQVKAGDVLATIDDTTAQANVEQTEASLGAAQAALDKILEPVTQTNLANAQAAVKAAEGAYTSLAGGTNAATINANQLTVQQANAAAQAAELNRMAAGRFGTDDPRYQQALAQVGAASFTAESARLKLQQSQRGPMLNQAIANVAVAQAKLAQVQAGPTQEQINSAQAAVASAQVAQDQAKHALDKTQLKAPYDGIVTSVIIKQNETAAGTAIVLTDLSELAVDVNVDEADIGQIRVGQAVDLTVDALPGVTLKGKVERIQQLADETASVITYTVHVQLDPTDAAIKAEMTANATFLIRQVTNVLRVPNQFVRTNPTTKQTTVQLVNPDGTLTEVPVTVGLQSSDYSEIVQGLSEGDTVALNFAAPATTGG